MQQLGDDRRKYVDGHQGGMAGSRDHEGEKQGYAVPLQLSKVCIERIKMKRLIVPILLCWNFCYACENVESKQHQTIDTVKPEIYNAHKIALADSISLFIEQHSSAYYQKENDSLTEVFIDTILYSPQKDKIAFFVITKNSNNKLLNGGSSDEFHYNAHCFIAYLTPSYVIRDISWLSAYNLSNYKSYKMASDDIRDIHFNAFKGKGSSKLKYNIGDKRFWNSSIWDDN